MSRARVHFTHHVCMLHPETLRAAGARNTYALYSEAFPDDHGSYGYRRPRMSLDGCTIPSGRRRPDYTLHMSDVTCLRCTKELAATSEQHWLAKPGRKHCAWLSDGELQMRAWVSCCSKLGLPCPFDEEVRIRWERHRRAFLVRRKIELQITFARIGTESERVANRLAESLAEMPAADRVLLNPLLDDAKEVDDLLALATQRLVAMERAANSVAERIGKSVLLSLAGGAA